MPVTTVIFDHFEFLEEFDLNLSACPDNTMF